MGESSDNIGEGPHTAMNNNCRAFVEEYEEATKDNLGL